VFTGKRAPRAYALACPAESLRAYLLSFQAKNETLTLPDPFFAPQPDLKPPVKPDLKLDLKPEVVKPEVKPEVKPDPVEPLDLQDLAERVAPLIPPIPFDELRVKELIAQATIAVTRVELERVVDGEKVVIDAGLQHKLFPVLAKVLSSNDPRMNLWIAGSAGSGKTKSVEILAGVAGYKFIRIPCGDQTLASLFMGFVGATGVYTPGLVWHAVEAAKSGEKVLVLWDEFDRMQPGVQTQANALLDGSPVTFPHGETIVLADFGIRQFVCANTFARPTADHPTVKSGDGSTTNRFAKLTWFYDEAFETALYADLPTWVPFVQRIRKAAKSAGVKNFCLSFRTHDQYRELRNLGCSHAMAERMAVWNGLPDDDVAKISQALGIRVPDVGTYE
jgi:hypothetical protein